MQKSCRTLFAGLLAAALLCGGAGAQTPQDVPQDHWAYKAVEELAAKGLVKGYPPSGNFLGKRVVSRYEMAVIVQRMLARVEELVAAGRRDVTPQPVPGEAVTPAQVAEIRKLVDEFRTELTVIRTDIQKHQQQLDQLKALAEKAAADAGEAKRLSQENAANLKDLTETVGIFRGEFEALQKNYNARKLSGYIQGRFESFNRGDAALFPEAGGGGTGQTPSTGGPAVGGTNYGFLVRRARLKFGGPISQRTEWVGQLDFPSTGAVAVKDAFINVSDLPFPSNTVASFGLFATPFGYELPHSSSSRESPERAAGFSDSTAPFAVYKTSVSGTGGTLTNGSVVPLFIGQDRDLGAAIAWMSPNYLNPNTRITLGVFNGEGRGASGVRNQNRQLDFVGRAETSFFGQTLDVGVSGYYGAAAVRRGAPTGTPAVPQPFVNGRRVYGGVYARWITPWQTVIRAEWMGGEHELTPDRSQFLPGNHAQAYYVALRHPIGKRLEGSLKYDEYYPIGAKGITVGGLGRSELMTKTLQGGFLYQLDDATRFRLWYAQGLRPYDPSAAAGSPLRKKLGLITAEVQVSY